MPEAPPLLQVRALSQQLRMPRRHLRDWLRPAPHLQVLQGVNFTLHAGRCLGVVGESGSGKSTLARLVMALQRPSSGQVLFEGQDLHALPAAALRALRPRFQIVLQDPYSALDPRRSVLQTVCEPLALLQGAQRVATAAERRRRAAQALEAVGLQAADLARYPHEFSGGQRQRIAIARAIVTRPRLLVADEPVSALDVSVQAQVLNLLRSLQREHGLALLFISHDLAVVDHLCDEVLVLHQGQVVEQGRPEQLFRQPQHAQTKALLQAVPGGGPEFGP